MKPTIGRIVHYVQKHGSKLCAAIITEVQPREELEEGTKPYDENMVYVDLHAFTPYGMETYKKVKFSEEPGVVETWSWPPKV